MLLEVENLSVSYGVVQAIRGVSLQIEEGDIVAVLGANGAGKTTLLRTLQGLQRPRSGDIRLRRQSIASWSAPRRLKGGLALVPEGRQIFVTLTVHENLLAGAYGRKDAGVAKDIEGIYARFPNLAARRDLPAVVLSGGEQQMLAISRALLARPALMMLDEPSLGLSPLLCSQVFALLKEVNAQGISVLLVEQNTKQALKISRRGLVLELGRLVMAGTPAELLADERLKQAYLGR
jgi:branched-chain amino acid transport system ATP-binding protein